MNPHRDVAAADAAARAMARVLQAERDAAERLACTRAQAAALVERARLDALAIVNRSGERIARVQRAHAAALERRLDVQRAAASAHLAAQPVPDDAAIHAAVAHVAALMTHGERGASA
jgi:hypothetical protein